MCDRDSYCRNLGFVEIKLVIYMDDNDRVVTI